MKAVVLAAGYATRLRPLTDTTAKELLPIAGRPVVDWISDRIAEVPEVDAVHVVTNARKAPWFHEWAEGRDVTVHDDGTRTNEDRLGAIGDIRFTLERAGIDDDVLVIAGDNLFDGSLAAMVAFWAARPGASVIGVHDVGSPELARQYGIVEVDGDGRLTGFVEKPDDPPSTLAATATYLLRREHAALVGPYLDGGGTRDQPGNFIAWLHRREPVYAYPLDGEWLDIGDRDQLLLADNRMRARHGLPQRDAYSPEG